jgi:hypothetical protein
MMEMTSFSWDKIIYFLALFGRVEDFIGESLCLLDFLEEASMPSTTFRGAFLIDETFASSAGPENL